MADNQLYAYEHIESARKRRNMNGPNSAQKGTNEQNEQVFACLLANIDEGYCNRCLELFLLLCVREFIRHEKMELI